MLDRLPDGRPGLVQRAFVSLDRLSGDGMLDMSELQVLARCTGFSGNDQQWADEYRDLCADVNADPSVGIGLPFFTHLVNDLSERGCYCSDDQLRELLQPCGELKSLPIVAGASEVVGAAVAEAAKATVAGVTRPRQPGTARGDGAVIREMLPTPSPTVIPPVRAELIRTVFEACDRNRDGVLDAAEMMAFAVLTGFSGSEAEWREEFRSLYHERRGRGASDGLFDVELFALLVEDQSENGCYCTDEDLRLILTALKAPPRAAAVAAPVASGPAAAQAKVQPQLPAVPSRRPAEAPLASRPSPCLAPGFAVLPQVAGAAAARVRPSEEVPRGHPVPPFVVPAAASAPPAATAAASTATPTVAGPQSGASTLASLGGVGLAALPFRRRSRTELLRAVFRLCDADRDGRLSSQELRTFAVQTGFDGSEEDWAAEYAALCRHANVEWREGVPCQAFEDMVDETEEGGCFCPDDELRGVRARLESLSLSGSPRGTPRGAASAHPPGSAPNGDGSVHAAGGGAGGGAGPPASAAPAPLGPVALATSPRGSAAATAAAASERWRLVARVFALCDLDGNGRLCEAEMLRFSRCTGFDGTPEEWAQEYKFLCEDQGADPRRGLTFEVFEKIVDDASEGGCYCSEEDLQEVARDLEKSGPLPGLPVPGPQPAPVPAQLQPRPPQAQAADRPAAAAPLAGAAPPPNGLGPPPSRRRSELLRGVFAACDRNRNGRLSQDELFRFAEATGFDLGAAAWAEEYRSVCQEQGADPLQGLDIKGFVCFVNDAGDGGCFCSDTELQELLGKWAFGMDARVSSHVGDPHGGEAAGPASARSILVPRTQEEHHHHTPTAHTLHVAEDKLQSARTSNGDASTVRAGLVAEVFKLCDRNRDGWLNQQEMEAFARHSGFDGDQAEWAKEFQLLCEERGVDPQTGVDASLFRRLVDDPGECYVADEDLHSILGHLRRRPLPSGPDVLPRGGTANAHVEPQPLQPLPPAARGGVPPARAAAVAAPQRAAGDDDELRQAHAAPSLQAGAAAPLAGTSQERPALIREVFQVCDADGDGFLSRREMQRLASQLGFEGSSQEWAAEFEVLCADGGADPSRGIGLPVLARIVDDTSERGLFCKDHELRNLVTKLRVLFEGPDSPLSAVQPPPPPAAPRPASALPGPPAADQRVRAGGARAVPAAAAEAERPVLIKALFRTCDRDGDGRLNSKEMGSFARRTGFQGDDFEWVEEFAIMCQDQGGLVSTGFTLEMFTRLVNDDSGDGCYCDDDELRAMLSEWVSRS